MDPKDGAIIRLYCIFLYFYLLCYDLMIENGQHKHLKITEYELHPKKICSMPMW